MKLLSVITTNLWCVLFRYVLSARIQNGSCQSINSGLGFRSVGNAQDFIFSNFYRRPEQCQLVHPWLTLIPKACTFAVPGVGGLKNPTTSTYCQGRSRSCVYS